MSGAAQGPIVPGLQVAARALPAVDGGGGDFSGVFRLDLNAWGLVVAEAWGRGAAAQERVAQAYRIIRQAASRHRSPAAVLAETDRRLDAAADPERVWAAAYARIEQDVCGAWLTLACAGIPLPVVVRRAGWIDVRGQAAPVLGSFSPGMFADDRVGLGPGDSIVFLSDGVTAVTDVRGELFGDECLSEVLLDSAQCDSDEIADGVLEALQRYGAAPRKDEATVVVLRVPPVEDRRAELEQTLGVPADELPLPGYPVGVPHWGANSRPAPPRHARMRLPAADRSVSRARQFVDSVLHSWRMSELAAGDVTVATSELATNAVRHGQSSFTVIVAYDGAVVRVEVGDGSRAMPAPREAPADALGGRGLAIVQQLTADWGTMPTLDGKRVWFCVAAPGP